MAWRLLNHPVMHHPVRLSILAALALCPAPALAAGGVPVPESSSLMLFALGVLGVIVGRQVARRGKDDDPR